MILGSQVFSLLLLFVSAAVASKCPDEEVLLKVTMKTDLFPQEDTWAISRIGCAGDAEDDVFKNRKVEDFEELTTYVDEFCVRGSKYKLVLKDMFRDGMRSDEHGDGYLKVEYDGTLVHTSEKFQDQDEFEFGECPPPPPPPPQETKKPVEETKKPVEEIKKPVEETKNPVLRGKDMWCQGTRLGEFNTAEEAMAAALLKCPSRTIAFKRAQTCMCCDKNLRGSILKGFMGWSIYQP